MVGRRQKQRRTPCLMAINPADPDSRLFTLSKSECSIGSDDSNDLVIRDNTVSRRHATIRRRRRRWELIDLGSTNGTFVDNNRISGSVILRDGQDVRFGNARLVFRRTVASQPRVSCAQSPKRKRSFRLRTAIELVVIAFVMGFAATQYSSYVNYRHLAETRSTKSNPIASPALQAPKAAPTEAASPAPQGIDSSVSNGLPSWLQRLNQWRAMASVAPVREDPDAVRGATAHARYMVKNYWAGNPETPHHEEPGNSWYTPEGAKAASNANEYGPGPPTSPTFDIDGWIDGSFHRLGLIERRLTAAAYVHYCESGICAELLVLDSRSQADTDPTWFGEFPEPVMFPSNGTTMPVNFATLISGEWPEPLSCPGYTRPAGYPITLQFDSRFVPKLLSFTLTRNGTSAAVCGYDSTSYVNPDSGTQAWARDVLKGQGAVVLIPREPLQPGATYSVTVNVQAQSDPFNWGSASAFAGQMRSYRWSFSVGPKD